MGKEEMKQYIGQQVEAIRSELMEISQYIFQNPEVAHTEHKACAKQVEYLKSKGYEVNGEPGRCRYCLCCDLPKRGRAAYRSAVRIRLPA